MLQIFQTFYLTFAKVSEQLFLRIIKYNLLIGNIRIVKCTLLLGA